MLSASDVVNSYLHGRGITVPVPPSIRAGTTIHLGRVQIPAMIVAVQRPDGKVVAVQSTLLTWVGKKAAVPAPRITTGALGAGAVRLGAAGDILGLAEGVETGLSAMQISGVPTWCCLGAGRMHRVAIPAKVQELHIFADDDDPGRAAAERTAALHTAAGRRVVLRYPPACCKDWNDALRALLEATA